MNAQNRNRYTFLKWGLLGLFSLYLAGISFFIHSHVVDNTKIVHSHPFKSNHEHATAQFIIIEQITHFVSHEDVIPLFDLQQNDILLCHISDLPSNPFILGPHLNVLSLRAPPAIAS